MIRRPDPRMSIFPVARPVKHRTRHMLPLEMCLAVMVLIVGIIGGLGHGSLAHALEALGNGTHSNNVIWLALLLGIGMTWLNTAFLEWMLGYTWSPGALRLAIWMRMWSAFLATGAWLLCGYVLAESKGFGMSLLLFTLLVPPMVVFNGWCWWVNMRAATIMDPTLNTERLEHRLESQRTRW